MGLTRSIDRLYIVEESTNGTFETPTGENFIEVVEASVPQIVSNVIEKRANPNSLIKTEASYSVKKHVEFTFTTYFRKIAGLSYPPRIAPLFKAAGFTETTGTDHIKYTPSTSIDTTVSVLAQYDVDLNPYEVKIKGAVVKSFTIKADLGDFILVEFTLQGVLESESATATSITPTDDTTQLIIAHSLATTAGIENLDHFEITVNNTIYESPDPSSTTTIGRYYVVAQEITGNIKGEFSNDFLPDAADEISSFNIGRSTYFAIEGAKVQLSEEDSVTIDNEVFVHSINLKFHDDNTGEPLSIKFYGS